MEKDFQDSEENLQPEVCEFTAGHLREWLNMRETLDRAVTKWLVRVIQQLDGFTENAQYEILEGEEGNDLRSGAPHRRF